ncbi:uncharacterized protein LOC117337290 [Pecten maximus]|uniref:uncharacterized protein LOC117337290 n=1 Tax=Pecten maximus TaxID=6579 RepID=UPI00145868CC|nr:uncharacterized protein LOC117337290 [Pecten maximus]
MADIRVPKGDTTRYRYNVHHVSNSTHDSLDILRKGKDIYMVYDCSNVYAGECGGWSDRLSGMLSVYVISLITNHTFLVRHNKPCPLEDYLDYNAHNWVFDKALVERGHLSYQYISYYCKVPTVVRSHRRERLAVTFNKDINFVRVNWDYTDHFRATKGIGKLVPWITTLQYSDIYRHFFNSLFKIKKEISDYLDIVKGEKKLACAHIRMGESGMTRTTLPELVDIWRVLKQMEKRKFSIFVATDSNLVKRKAKALFSRSSVEIDGVITHIDVTKKGDLCGGFRKAVLDFFMLTRCEELVITRSGFGIMAAYLRRRDKLHCLTPNGVVSCTRFTIHNIYPSPILSPF